jgi:hypothetical protein
MESGTPFVASAVVEGIFDGIAAAVGSAVAIGGVAATGRAWGPTVLPRQQAEPRGMTALHRQWQAKPGGPMAPPQQWQAEAGRRHQGQQIPAVGSRAHQ